MDHLRSWLRELISRATQTAGHVHVHVNVHVIVDVAVIGFFICMLRTIPTAVHDHVNDHVNVYVDVHVLVDVDGFSFGCGIGRSFPALRSTYTLHTLPVAVFGLYNVYSRSWNTSCPVIFWEGPRL